MQKNKGIFYISVLIAALQVCFYSSVKANQEKALEILQVVADGGSCYFAVKNAYGLYQGVNTLVHPSQERQDQVQEIKDQLKLIELRRKFVTCLVENRAGVKKETLRIPSACEQAAFLLGSAGAVNETERMMAVFKALNT